MKTETPILITGLPRSRTAWLAAYFGTYHDLSIKTSVPDMLIKIGERGDSDSGLIFHFRDIQKRYPFAKWVYVKRDAKECRQSAEKLFAGKDISEAWKKTETALHDFLMEVTYYTLPYHELNYSVDMRALHEWLDIPFDYEKFRTFKDLRITTTVLCQRQS